MGVLKKNVHLKNNESYVCKNLHAFMQKFVQPRK